MAEMAVCIVNYNTCEDLKTCVETILLDSPSEIVVVDNASSDGSAEMVKAAFPRVLLIANDSNVGYGAAANQGIRSCASKYVLLLNSDTRILHGSLRAISEYLDLNSQVAIVGPRLINVDGTLQPSCHPFPSAFTAVLEYTPLGELIRYIPVLRNYYLPAWPHTSARVVPWLKGAALGIRRGAFEALGGFDGSFFMYFEEVDLCYRLTAAGWQIHFAPITTVAHIGEASTSQCREKMDVQLFESNLLFGRRHYSGLSVAGLVIVLECVRVARLIRDCIRAYIKEQPA